MVTVGACIANGTHGIIPKKGIFTDFVREIELYNPNFGKKILSKSKNKKIFELTKCGFGLTGIIISAKLKIFKIKSTSITVKHQNVKSLIDCYRLIKNSKYLYQKSKRISFYLQRSSYAKNKRGSKPNTTHYKRTSN